MNYLKRKFGVLALVVATGILGTPPLYSWVQSLWREQQFATISPIVSSQDQQRLHEAIARKTQHIWVSGIGVVTRHLADDTKGSRHQRFLVDVDGTSILISHNIDLASTIHDLPIGTVIAFRGEYVWNIKGGVLHWTHHDPKGEQVGGWIQVGGQRFQ